MTDESLTPERIWKTGFGFAPPLILEAAIRNGVFDVLEPGPRTLEEVVAETGASRRGLRVLLNALVALEFLEKRNSSYALTPESATFLVSDQPEFQGGMFRHISRQMLPNWLDLAERVRTGNPAVPVNSQEEGAEFFKEFVEDLFPRGYPAARVLAGELVSEEAKKPLRVLDLAAGSGVWSVALAERSPLVEVTAVDWSLVIPVTRRVTERRGVGGRYRFLEGDLLEVDFGSDFDVAVLGHILHSEGERRSQALLHKVFVALRPGGTVAIAEVFPDEDRTGPAHALVFAVNMLVHTEEGDAFTLGEISGWLREAGFEAARLLEVPAPTPLILASKPGNQGGKPGDCP